MTERCVKIATSCASLWLWAAAVAMDGVHNLLSILTSNVMTIDFGYRMEIRELNAFP